MSEVVHAGSLRSTLLSRTHVVWVTWKIRSNPTRLKSAPWKCKRFSAAFDQVGLVCKAVDIVAFNIIAVW